MTARLSMKEFPKTAMNRKASEVYEAAAAKPVSLSEHGKSRFVIMSRRFFDEHFDTSVSLADQAAAKADRL